MLWNIIFNYASRLFAAFSTFLFVPAYIAALGADGYSVIALSILVVSLILVLEIGLTAAISREMARKDVTDSQRRRAFVVVERMFLLFFVVLSILSLLFSDAFVIHVIGETAIDKAIVAKCVSIIGIEAGLQLLFRFHLSVLIGLERQVRASLFNMLWAALRNGAVIGVIWVYPDLYAFFIWQLAATFMVVVALKLHSIGIVQNWPRTRGLVVDIETLRGLRGFAGGMLLISFVTLANTQLDRLLVGSLASLLELGAYSLAATIGTAMLIAASPIMMAVQPRLTQYFTVEKTIEARALFRKSTRSIALLVIPVAVIAALHPEAVLNAWLGNPEMTRMAAPIVPFLVIANASIAIATISHAVALANGYTRYSNAMGLLSLLISIPGYYYSVSHYGVTGVAMVYLAVQLISTLTLSFLLMNKFLGGGFLSHHAVSYVTPLVGALLGAYVFGVIFGSEPESRIAILFWLLSGTILVSLSGVGLATVVWRLADRLQQST